MNPLSQWLKQLGRPAVWAHRGASHVAPENSLAALRLAAGQGADGVEFDVQRCASGELVVFHDDTLGRCTGALGSIHETPWTRLQSLRLGRWASARHLPQTDERIPLLSDWLAEIPPALFVNLEVKCDVLAHASSARDCVRALRRGGLDQRSVVSSFHPAALWHSRAEDAAIPLGVLIEHSKTWKAPLVLGLAARASAIHAPHTLVTRERVVWWHRLGYAVAAWTVDDLDVGERCLDAGVDVLISNRPDLMRPLTERYARSRS